MNNWLAKGQNIINNNLKNKWFIKIIIFSWNLFLFF